MSIQDTQGKTKKAAGDLTGDRDLKREGQADQAADKIKKGIDRLTDKFKSARKK